MITALTIHNYALIDHIALDFSEGLTVITGETGAGKSILLDALSLVLGKRADLSSIKDTSKKCFVEVHLAISSYNLKTIFESNDIDYEDYTILRRELLPGGKSRAFVNDSPVTLSQLQVVAEQVISIHSQHETQKLFTEKFQIQLIDAFANNKKVLEAYSAKRKEYIDVTNTLSKLITNKDEASKEYVYSLFLLEELKAIPLDKINQESLEEDLEKLENAELIQIALAEAAKILSQEPIGTLETAKEARLSLNKIKTFSKAYQMLWERLNSIIIEAEDIYNEIYDQAEQVTIDPEAILKINQTLQELYKLQKKHQVNTVEELIQIQSELEQKVQRTQGYEEQIQALEVQKNAIFNELNLVSEKLRKNRKEAFPKLKKQLEIILEKIGMPQAQFKFVLEPLTEFREFGNDSLQILFTANTGMPFQELKKVASGGELSRIMLAIKAILSKYQNLPTLILDEIDTGVSGDIANKMGDLMKSMSTSLQLIVITHLPQIAAKGETHIKIFKESNQNKTVTGLKKLTKEARILEIASMMGGNSQSDTAIKHAKELLN